MAEGAMIGAAVPRREDQRLLTGAGTYLDDVDLPGCYEAAFLRSPHAAARVLGIDTSAAKAVPGVIGVWTGRELTDLVKPIPPKVTNPKLVDVPRYPLPPDAAHFVGEPLAVVVATSRHVAEDAVELIDVDYEVLPAIASTGAALAEDAPKVHEEVPDNVAIHLVQTAGDPETALETAPHRLRERFIIARGGGHSMETRGIAARYDASTGQFTVWPCSQSPHYTRNLIASFCDVVEDDVRVVVPRDNGGGFGPKAQFHGEDAVVPYLARLLDNPVKWIEDRSENFVATMMERTQVHDVEVAFDDDGRLLAVKDVFQHDQGAYCAGLQVPTITLSTLPGQYRIPNIHSELIACYTNMVPTSSVRGAGRPQAVVAMERMVDRIAEHLGADPAEVRRINLVQADEFPYRVGLTFRDGSPLTYDSGDFPALHQAVLDKFDYEGERARQRELREQGRLIGIGLGAYVEGCGLGPYEGARLRLTNNGMVLVTLAATPLGQGYETVYAQIASDAMGLDMRHIAVATGDTARIPFGQGSFASRTTVTAGSATFQAAQRLRDLILEVAEVLLKTSAADLRFDGDRVCVVGSPERGVTLAEVAQVANIGKHGITMQAGVPAGIEATSYFAPERAAYASGMHAATVEVDPETGAVRILRYVIGHDCGTVINPMLVDGQVLGGFAHGIGNALYEEPCYDEAGQPQTTSYLDYALPSSVEVPPVELVHLYTPSPLNPLGVKGAGEGGTIPVPATIANAVEDALRPFGARINNLPLTPAKIFAAVSGG
ncbi:xanthine dehydrogenase family protein molybdopterin-binding subunit [Saccharopolyspora sp. K220]|uniref:xanthine dehydrogenase family protein molybdopterin-binding subunit n=1 Tax=Saccharopolyspora soli TaxID=2926618 RepID=UPI001F562D5C|nr:xanthine dehydrogenase family protein molybdopterin-binding subunit [Saccharopolyspora soli]MCI2422253.1 xanthine dehydrogenase family protein molybdopterin-binding subunit [Saccharopolyspora soli]